MQLADFRSDESFSDCPSSKSAPILKVNRLYQNSRRPTRYQTPACRAPASALLNLVPEAELPISRQTGARLSSRTAARGYKPPTGYRLFLEL
jgi:hypothetical protein